MTSDDKPSPEPAKIAEAQPKSRVEPFHPPEIQAQIDEFDRKLADALVKNLNARVKAEHPDKPAET